MFNSSKKKSSDSCTMCSINSEHKKLSLAGYTSSSVFIIRNSIKGYIALVVSFLIRLFDSIFFIPREGRAEGSSVASLINLWEPNLMHKLL